MYAKKFVAGFVASAVLAMALAGCGSKKDEAPAAGGQTPAAAKKPVELTVWSHLTEKEVAELDKVAQEWAKKTGNKVTVQNDQTGFQEYAAAAQAGAGPDIMYGLPHDNLGTFQKAGLLEPVPAGVINPADFKKVAIDAVSFDGKQYAVPVSMEAIGLVYNKKLVANPPKTWDEFMKAAKEKGFAYKVKDFYFSFGFMGGMGGYVFKSNNGALDPKDVGLANEGAQKGLQLIADFIHKDKLMPVDIDYDPAKAAFMSGKQGMWLTGPWEVSAIKEAGIDFGVAPMPTLPNGQPFTPFVGVQAAFVASGSKNKEAAWDFIKYMNENAPLPLFKIGNRIPVQNKFADNAEVKANAALAGFAASAEKGVPMPNIPAMQAVWGPAGSMIDLVVNGTADVKKASSETVKAINEAIAGMK